MGISTPLPLYVELADGVNVAKVQARYKSPASAEWKTLDFNKLEAGYGIELPCADVGATPGELRYYIQTINANGEPSATHGTRNAPHVVPIVSELSGAPAHLPGKPAPDACSPASCAPGSPGSPKAAAGASCSGRTDAECVSAACRDQVCVAEEPTSKTCQADADCGAGGACVASVCGARGKQNWLSIAIQQEGLFLPSASGACSSDTTYTCYDGPYLYNRKNLTAGSDNVAGGFALGTARVLVGYDRVLGAHITLRPRRFRVQRWTE